ncbi:alpha-amylase family glycosyl hydrolase [Inhella sp.]|uniref:alpha-amylase family glycosyl hydrolase n=1 Tax=Inhella sp. TaxID=1921806 RepID=UPI0035B1FDF0
MKRFAFSLAPTLALLALLAPAAHTAPLPPVRDVGPVAAKPVKNSLPEGWQRGPFMEIFVRAYQDSDGDGHGDLRGLIQRLDHLKELGVTGIWLMPVQQSQDRDHGYATRDYRAIERDYGTLADFDALLKAAHARGIGVIIDYVVNHGAWTHPTFLHAKSSPKSRYRDWYLWAEGQPPGWSIWDKHPWYPLAYECPQAQAAPEPPPEGVKKPRGGPSASCAPWTFKGELKDLPKGAGTHYYGTFGPHMPDFNLRRAEVFDWHLDNLRFWLNRGLNGFRLDAVPHLVETSAKDWNDQPISRRLTRRLVDQIEAYPRTYTVCEATAEPVAWASPEVCGSAFAFGLEGAVMDAVKGEKRDAVQRVADFFKTRPLHMATMLANHDIFAGHRIWDQVKGDEARYRLAAASLLLLPGTPFLYYGEEIGQGGLTQLKGDFPIRGPMSWTAAGGFSRGTPFRPVSPNAATHNADAQRAHPGSLFHHYRQLIALRKAQPALHAGSYDNVQVQGSLLRFERATATQRLRVTLNYATEPATAPRQGRLLWVTPGGEGEHLPAWGARVEQL